MISASKVESPPTPICFDLFLAGVPLSKSFTPSLVVFALVYLLIKYASNIVAASVTVNV